MDRKDYEFRRNKCEDLVFEGSNLCKLERSYWEKKVSVLDTKLMFFFFFGWVLLDFPVLRFFLFPLIALGNFLHITSLSLSSFSWFDRASYHFLVKKPSSFFSWGLKKRLYLTTYWLLLFVWTCLLEIWRSFPVWWFSSVTFAEKKIK